MTGHVDAAPPLAQDRYRLVERIGVGGMAVVYRAWDERLRVWRAIKVLGPAAAHNPALRTRFEHEAQAMARLHHPNLVTVHDIGIDGDRPYMVMDLAPTSVDAQLRATGPLAPRTAARWMVRVLDALAAAHAEGVIHRDIKPANLLIGRTGEPLVADFGIAHLQDAGLTHHGAAIGTRGFMAPEQLGAAGTVDGRADLYATGATLAALITGRAPPDPDPDPSQLADLPAPLAAIVARAMRRSPAERYRRADEMAAAIAAVIDDLPEDPGSFVVDLVARTTDPPPPSGAPSDADAPRSGSEDTWAGTVFEPDTADPRAHQPSLSPRWLVPFTIGAAVMIGVLVQRRVPPEPPAPSYAAPRQVTHLSAEQRLVGLGLTADGTALVTVTPEAVWRQSLDDDLPPQRILDIDPPLGGHQVALTPTADAMLVTNDDGAHMRLVPLDGGPERDLGREGWAAKLSPDGRRIGYVTSDGVFVAALDGGRALTLIPWSDRDYHWMLGWSPDGAEVMVASHYPSGMVLRAFPVRDPGAPRTLLRDDGLLLGNGLVVATWPEPGRVVFGRRIDVDHTEIAVLDPRVAAPEPTRIGVLPFDSLEEIDVDAGRVAVVAVKVHRNVWLADVGPGGAVTNPRRFSLGLGAQRTIGWADDGRVLYAEQRGELWDVGVQRLDERTGRIFAHGAATWPLHGGPIGVVWAGPPDVPPLVVPWDAPAPVAVASAAQHLGARCTDDGRCAVLIDQGDAFAIAWVDRETGARTEVARGSGAVTPTAWALSPDGARALAILDHRRILTFDLATGAMTTTIDPDLFVQTAAARTDVPGWWLTGRLGDAWRIFTFDGATVATALTVETAWPNAPAPSPDGRHLAFTRWDWEANAWVFDPAP